VVLAVLAVPGLRELGITVMAAHLIVLWYSQDSNITPPVCLASYAAAGIAESDPMKTGLYSWALAKGLYLIPLLFVYTNILSGGFFEIISIALIAVFGLFAMTLALEGYLIAPIHPLQRICFLIVTVCCFWGSKPVNLFGVSLMVLLVILHAFFAKKSRIREEA
jgi:TRAP-type uncharacterized transport system fused permease subunit